MFGKAILRGGRAAEPSDRRLAAHLAKRGRGARNEGRFADAAALYEEALRLHPGNASLIIQAGHMRKEAGDYAAAEAHYDAALLLRPDNAELALQLGHFYKVAGRPGEAEEAYLRAAALKPGWDEPRRELDGMAESGWRGRAPFDPSATPAHADLVDPLLFALHDDLDIATAGLAEAGATARLVPALVPRRPSDLLHNHHDRIDVRRLGRREPGFWGQLPTLRGVEAIRGHCVSGAPIVEMQVLLNGLTIHRGPLKGGYDLAYERDKERFRKYVFNLWLDFTPVSAGAHALELRFLDVDDRTRSHHERIVVAAPMDEADHPGSDALVSPAPGDVRPIEDQIRARPSIVRPAARRLFPDQVRTILVMRTDQLGDMVGSIPAIVRLRALFPGARIVGLLTSANAELGRTLGLLDEIIVIDFPDDRFERRRVMPLAAQEALRQRLAPYGFDLAIDLAQASVSRELLLLSDAPFRYGVGGGDWPWLSAEFGLNTHDPRNGLDIVAHSGKTLALIETLGAMIDPGHRVMRRDDLSRDLLDAHGLAGDDRFIVLHLGARVEFSRWPHYPALAARLLAETDFKIVMMTEDPAVRPSLPPEIVRSDRFQLLDERLSFDMFDAFISFASAVVGNDSGPKHLASLRGTPVVTLFTARINWSEWGQEEVGAIISRRVPCAGCAIFHDPEECGKDFACIRDIRVDEVFETLLAQIAIGPRS